MEVLYEDEPLKEYYTLMDIAYIYPWRRVSGAASFPAVGTGACLGEKLGEKKKQSFGGRH